MRRDVPALTTPPLDSSGGARVPGTDRAGTTGTDRTRTAGTADPSAAHRDPPSTPRPLANDTQVTASRLRLRRDGFGIIASVIGFGLVYGLAARAAGFSLLESSAMSIFVFAGAAQFSAIGYVLGGFSWAGVVLLTAFLNARHLLYATALSPYLADRPRSKRAAMAHVLTDEAFALSIAHFRRIGRGDDRAYWWAAIVAVFVPWNLATIAGGLIGGQIPDPTRLGLDVISPAAMAGLAVGLITERREVVAAVAGAVIGVGVGLASDPAAGILAGGLLGPAVGMLMPVSTRAH